MRTTAGPRPRRIRTALTLTALTLVAFAVTAGAAGAHGARPDSARAAGYARTIADGRAAAQELLAQSGAASLSLALYAGDRVVWQEGFGYADKAAMTKPGADTMYGIGSVSKMLAAVAAMKLVDAGRLELDAPLVRYLPQLGVRYPVYGQVTLRMLLDHSSGLPGTTFPDAVTATYFPGYLQEVLDAVAGERPKTTPGLFSVYCNDGFTLVEALVAAVTGKTYAEYVRDEVLTPLGMDHSAYPVQPFAKGTYAEVYQGDEVMPQLVVNSFGSGGLFTTPGDLTKLGAMFIGRGSLAGTRVLSADSVAEMGTDQTLGSFNPVPCGRLAYGLGWDTVAQPGLGAVGVVGWSKDGDSDNYHCGFIVAPQAGLVVAVTSVTPLGSGECMDLGERILLHALVDQGTIRRLPKPVKAAAPKARPATAAQLAAMTGYWASSGAVFRSVAAPGDPQSLTLAMLAGGDWAPLYDGLRLRTDGRFHTDGSPDSVGTIAAGARRYLVSTEVRGAGHYRESNLVAQKLQPLPELSAAWEARVGHVWLAVSGRPDATEFSADGGPVLAVGDIPGLPGHVTVGARMYGNQVVDPSESDTLGSMLLQIPGNGSRNLEDLTAEQHDGEEWMKWGNSLFRPLATVPALLPGANTVTTGAKGYAEWRSVPATATLTIAGAGAWYLYDDGFAVLAAGTASPQTTSAPAGSYLVVFAPPSSDATVTLTAR